MARLVVVFLLALAAMTRAQHASTTTRATTKPAAPLRVLFIGDNYTSANGGIDGVLQALAISRGQVVECAASTASGKSLHWHWHSGDARRRVREGTWNYVVLQPSPIASTAEALELLDVIRSFDAEVRKAGAKTVVLSTPVGPAQSKGQRVLTSGLERLDEQSDASVAPVGAATESVIVENPSLKIRGTSEQPTRAGTYLAACVVYTMLYEDAAEGLPATITAAGKALTIPPADAKVIQMAADDATGSWLTPTTGPVFGNAEERVVFVVDATGTMLGLKFRIAQEHLRRAVSRLTPQQRFNVVFFQGGDDEDDWRAPLALELLPANDENKHKAVEFINRTMVVGRGTNPLPALRLAFRLRPDVIHFVSDGQFDNVVSYEAVQAELRKLNARRRTRLNTIALMSDDSRGEAILVTFARDHGGQFRKLTDKDVEPATRPVAP